MKTWHEEDEEDEDEDEEEDEFGNEEPKEWHDQFLRMVPMLTTSTAEIKKDPKAKFFPGWFVIWFAMFRKAEVSLEEIKKAKQGTAAAAPQEKGYHLKDYVRERALEAMEKGEEGDVFGSDEEEEAPKPVRTTYSQIFFVVYSFQACGVFRRRTK